MFCDVDSVKPGCRFVDFSTSVSYDINFNRLTPLDTDLLNSVDLNIGQIRTWCSRLRLLRAELEEMFCKFK